MVLNPKIIKINTAIDKTKEQIAEMQSKLKDLEKQKTQLENEEIVAMFRREKLNEDEFAQLLQSGRKKSSQSSQQAQPRAKPDGEPQNKDEGGIDADDN